MSTNSSIVRGNGRGILASFTIGEEDQEEEEEEGSFGLLPRRRSTATSGYSCDPRESSGRSLQAARLTGSPQSVPSPVSQSKLNQSPRPTSSRRIARESSRLSRVGSQALWVESTSRDLLSAQSPQRSRQTSLDIAQPQSPAAGEAAEARFDKASLMSVDAHGGTIIDASLVSITEQPSAESNVLVPSFETNMPSQGALSGGLEDNSSVRQGGNHFLIKPKGGGGGGETPMAPPSPPKWSRGISSGLSDLRIHALSAAAAAAIADPTTSHCPAAGDAATDAACSPATPTMAADAASANDSPPIQTSLARRTASSCEFVHAADIIPAARVETATGRTSSTPGMTPRAYTLAMLITARSSSGGGADETSYEMTGETGSFCQM